MIAVLFEVTMESRDRYLEIAAALHPQAIDGFISIARYESLTEKGKLLSLSFWRDEAAVAAWRNTAEHRAAQIAGRSGLFTDYRLRIATVVRDYGRFDRTEAPPDSRIVHDQSCGAVQAT